MRAKFVFEKFTEDSDPIEDMGMGMIPKIEEWLKNSKANSFKQFRPKNIHIFDKFDVLDYIEINDDGSIDVINCDLHFWNFDENFPEYIQFNKIDGDFSITESKGFNSLHGFPRIIEGSFQFFRNGIRPTEEKIRSICDVKGEIMLRDWQSEEKSKSNKRYRALGPLSQRKTHVDKSTKGITTFSKGYKLWKILKFIEDAGSSGRRYTDIIKFSHEMTYGKGSFVSNIDRGYWSGAFAYGMIPSKTNKNNIGNYTLNQAGIDYLDKHRPYFDDKINY